MPFQKGNTLWKNIKNRKPRGKTINKTKFAQPRRIERLCLCGCGQKAILSRYAKGYIWGHWHKFITQPTGDKSPTWKGGLIKKRGYVFLYLREHPHGDRGYVKRSRLIMEEKLGRYLLSQEHVHHINGVRDDDRPENLIILSKGEHKRLHNLARHRINFICKDCKKQTEHFAHDLCNACYAKEWRKLRSHR